MSAPKNAVPLAGDSDLSEKGTRKLMRKGVSHEFCGWRGTLGELLCDPDADNEPVNNFWCPNCRSRGWIWD